jgi:hypothetical protein
MENLNNEYLKNEHLNNICLDDQTIKNKPRTIAVIFLILLFIFIFLIFLPPIIGLKGMDGGFAVSFISFFLALSSLIVTIIYFQMARKFRKIISGDNLIAHWKYEGEEWLKFAEKEYKYEKGKNKTLLLIIGIIALAVFVIFTLFDPEIWRFMFMVLLGLMALLAVFAFLVPWLSYKSRKKSSYQLYLSKNGVYVGGSFHIWGFLGSKLENAAFNEKEMQITLEYSYPVNTGRSIETVHIPVPVSRKDTAKEAVEKLVEIL